MKRLLTLLLLLFVLDVHAEDPAAILQRVDDYRSPHSSFSMDIELTSISGGKSETQRMRILAKGDDRSRIEFTYPSSEKGKSLLMLRDAMWVFLPSASRPIRISPMQRLLGQASNGDVARTSFSVDYVVTSASRVAVDGREAWQLDLAAKDPSVAYKRVVLAVDMKSYEPIRADFHVASGKLVKRAHYRELSMMSGRRLVTRVEIEDLLRAGNRTVMTYSNLTPRENPDRLFTKESLGR
jgi:outer membrane lipoprotein-sorting protein